MKLGDKFYAKIYGNDKVVRYDGVQMTVAYINTLDDLMILTLPPEVPVFYKKMPYIRESSNTKLYLVSPFGVLRTGEVTRAALRGGYTSVTGTFPGVVEKGDFFYSTHGNGLCGSWLVTEDGFLLGHHVAGNNLHNQGLAKCFRQETLAQVRSAILGKDKVFFFKEPSFSVVEEAGLGASVVKIDTPGNATFNSKSNLVKSKVNGIYPELRKPANLTFAGKDSTLVQAKKAFVDTKPVHDHAMKWTKKYMRSIIPKFRSLSPHEAYNGMETLGRIRLDTSAGKPLGGEKGDHVYVSQHGPPDLSESFTIIPKPYLEDMVEQARKDILEGVYEQKWPTVEALKDELRNTEKVDSPRVFAVVPFPEFIMERMAVGHLLVKLHEKRYETGVMVGLNVFSEEWAELRQHMTSLGDNCFDGDVGNYDKNMLSVFQRENNEDVVDACVSDADDKKILAQILENKVCNLRMCGDVMYFTTHGGTSGSLITGDFNSLIHKRYNLYIFCRLFFKQFGRDPTFEEYDLNVKFVAYGDDCLVGVSNKYKSWFNAKTVQGEFREMGMDFTPADKGDWKYETTSIDNCTFLKRAFVHHPQLGVIVAPLEERSMNSTLNYVKDSFRNEELTHIKLLNYQREAYLHHDYRAKMRHVEEFLKQAGIRGVVFHSEQHLIELYISGGYFDLLEMH
jgi:hypothetical protein